MGTSDLVHKKDEHIKDLYIDSYINVRLNGFKILWYFETHVDSEVTKKMMFKLY
jgi:hypothetical protein